MRLIFILSLIAIILLLKYYVSRTFSKYNTSSIDLKEQFIEKQTNTRTIIKPPRTNLNDQETYFLSNYNIITNKISNPNNSNVNKYIENNIIGYYNKIDYSTLKLYNEKHKSMDWDKFLDNIGRNKNKEGKTTSHKNVYYVKYTDRGINMLIFKPDNIENPNAYTIYYTDITGDIIFINKLSEHISDDNIFNQINEKAKSFIHNHTDLDKLKDFIHIPITFII